LKRIPFRQELRGVLPGDGAAQEGGPLDNLIYWLHAANIVIVAGFLIASGRIPLNLDDVIRIEFNAPSCSNFVRAVRVIIDNPNVTFRPDHLHSHPPI
jgi:hypothetical protein